ncbi:similarity to HYPOTHETICAL PROTEIN CGB0_HUMAN [Encephalitozoon cuniculi GB-M1]|uniref:RRM domain-containing protein n=2 Tax=Encephalitozoon cuniculi TaxID=6035 RepID=Q8SWE3_ENCCU|nr:uncharacterized protein ECU02_0530 [Encephalitozoon cuniculi GB-M1]AGE95640.1 hypothetical protein ECU02_0530 [Encephalitozoon cuniculi]KMV66573.1 hypothetical protein M970_020480 [Encephalitozoon cuniculi EcunIII-L]UYI28243.1 putative nuclear cap-binding protein subunit [Encephalitozoon cuniculi]CAD25084.1 similarity to HYPOTHETICAL PROTEIN CGB0_HUMAN [Encephalitozoon cuniculi GB-M1]
MDQIETQILFVRNLPKDVSKDKVVELFGEYGTIVQIRIGVEKNTAGSAFVVYSRVEGARKAMRRMNGYYLDGMYLNVGYWQPFDKFRLMMSRR